MLLDDFRSEYARYRKLGDGALAQVSDDGLNALPSSDGNSVAMVVRHVGGNLISRFTNFTTTDGEKPDRDREREFEIRTYTRDDVEKWWRGGWTAVETALAALNDKMLEDAVTIRGQPLTIHAALCRSLSHTSYHVGQIVLLARMHASGEWKSLSIPRGGSEAYNKAPTRERG
jgi:uncharacterized protein DUF1572